MISKSLAHYQVLEKIGEGGMGEVYRARDTTLDRDVALKVLPAHLVADAERIARFEREAKVLAALNHSGIAAVYGFHEQEGVRFLAMELAPGPDLSQRIAQGPIPVDEALPIAARIAEALEYAHERSIIHRDLKPANVKVTGAAVKVLDFGLAKAFAPEGEEGGPTSTPTMLPTVTSGGTRHGMILGTAAYMSPEQARGQAVDRRADIWAFGCLLYEMLTGKMLFPGDTVSDTIAAVLRADVDLTALPAQTPASVRHLLERCLDRDPATRLRDIGEARIVLSDPAASGAFRILTPAEPAATRASRTPVVVAATALAALVLGLFAGRVAFREEPVASTPAFLFDIQDTTGALMTGDLALSPDGTHLVFPRRGGEEVRTLHVRRLDQPEFRTLPGTAEGRHPFWSPDGTEVGFFVGNTLYRVGLDGSAARRVAVLDDRPMGGTWNADGVILVGTYNGPILRTAAGGEAPVPLTEVEEGVEDAHVWPAFLPDGEHYVFLADAATDEGHRLYVRSLDGTESNILRKAVRSAIAVDPTGALLLIDNRQLIAFPFDFGKREITGSSILVEDELQPIGQRHESPFTISANGVLALQRGSDESTLMIAPLDGSSWRVLGARDRYRNPVMSADGRRMAFEIQTSSSERLIWVEDLDRGARTLISKRGALADSPAWSADGEWLYFGSNGENDIWTAYRKRVAGGQPPELVGVPEGTRDLGVLDCSPDGKLILVAADVGEQGWGLYLGHLEEGPATWTEWVNIAANEQFGRFSPDGQWIAFQSEATGRSEIYIAPVEGGPGTRQWMISVNGGSDPAWSPDGTRVYYRTPAEVLMAVGLDVTESDLTPSPPERLFELHAPEVGYLRNAYDPTPDGNAVLAFVETVGTSAAIRVRTGWREW